MNIVWIVLMVLRLAGASPFQGAADRRLTRARLLSMDAFDTLICRPVMRPADVFALCAGALRDEGISRMTPAAWRALRHEVETELARDMHPREVQLDDIYQALARRGALANPSRLRAAEIEREMERRLCRPVAANIAAVNAFVSGGGKAVVLSDTCLPQHDLVDMLSAAGLCLPMNCIHTSSDSGRTKRGGELFGHVMRLERSFAAHALHVGDSLISDLRQAWRSGLAAAPYLDGKPSRYERRLSHALGTAPLFGSIVAGSARATRLSRALPSQHAQVIWNVAADVTGPLLFAFVAWTLREAQQRGLRSLYYLSRDGEILLRIAREMQPTLAPQVDCRYLHVSRRSLHLPAVVTLGPEERNWILDNAHKHGLSHWLNRLDLDAGPFLAALPADSPLRARDPEAPLGEAAVVLLAETLDIPAVQALILSRAAQARAECLIYMERQEILAPGEIGIVDIGWKGRLQRSLCRAVSTIEPHFSRRLHGFYLDLDAMPSGVGELAVFSALCPEGEFSWARRGSLFEIFCAAHHGSVAGYRDGVPILTAPNNPEAEAWGIGVQQTAVVAFVREVMQCLAQAGIAPLDHLEPLASAAQEVARLLIVRPRPDEANAFGSFIHAYDEQHRVQETIAELIDFRPAALWKRLGPNYRRRRISIWPEASLARSLPGWLVAPALTALHLVPGRLR